MRHICKVVCEGIETNKVLHYILFFIINFLERTLHLNLDDWSLTNQLLLSCVILRASHRNLINQILTWLYRLLFLNTKHWFLLPFLCFQGFFEYIYHAVTFGIHITLLILLILKCARRLIFLKQRMLRCAIVIFKATIHEDGFSTDYRLVWWRMQVQLRLLVGRVLFFNWGFQIMKWKVQLRGYLSHLALAWALNQNELRVMWWLWLDKRWKFSLLIIFLLFWMKIWSSLRHRLGLPNIWSAQINLFMTYTWNGRILFF